MTNPVNHTVKAVFPELLPAISRSPAHDGQRRSGEADQAALQVRKNFSAQGAASLSPAGSHVRPLDTYRRGEFYTTSGTAAEIIPSELYSRGVIINTRA